MSDVQKTSAKRPSGASENKDLIKAIAGIACGVVGIFFLSLVFGVVAVALSANCNKKGTVTILKVIGLILGAIDVIIGLYYLMGWNL